MNVEDVRFPDTAEGWINVKTAFGLTGDGITNEYANLNNAITTARNEPADWFFPKGTYFINGSITIPSNIIMHFSNGAMLSPAKGTTVSINGGIDAGLVRIFNGQGTFEGKFNVEKVFPQWWGAAGDGTTDCSPAFFSAVTSLMSGGGGNLFFPAGVYMFGKEVAFSNFSNIHISGDKNAVIRKTKNFTVQAIIKFSYSDNVKISGLRFEGKTSSTTDHNWGDDGIMFLASTIIDISDCYFKNFGDSALRIRSDYYTTVTPLEVNSYGIRVTGNTFENIQQTSTTPGGSKSYLFANNVIKSCKGSIKFASVIQNAGKLIISNNIILKTKNGFEFMSVSNLDINNNQIEGTDYGIVVYTNIDLDTAINPTFPWGNLLIHNNMISKFMYGIRVRNQTYSNGDTYAANNIDINNNLVSNSTENAIFVSYGTFSNVNIHDNMVGGTDGGGGISFSSAGIDLEVQAFAYIGSIENSRNCVKIQTLPTGLYAAGLGNYRKVDVNAVGNNSTLTISQTNGNITINLATDSTGKITTTLDALISAFNADPDVNYNFAASLCVGGHGDHLCGATGGVLLDGISVKEESIRIQNNFINGITSMGNAYGIRVTRDSSGTRNLKDVSISGNEIKGIQGNGTIFRINIDKVDNCMIKDNRIYGGIVLTNCNNVTVRDNRIKSYGNAIGINTTSVNKLKLKNNEFDCEKIAIRYGADTLSVQEIHNIIMSGTTSKNNAVPYVQTNDSGSPEGVVTAGAGSVYYRTDGGRGTSMYIKETSSGNTGWAAK